MLGGGRSGGAGGGVGGGGGGAWCGSDCIGSLVHLFTLLNIIKMQIPERN